MRGRETCGTRIGRFPRRGKLAGHRLGLVALLLKCSLLFNLRRLGDLRGLGTRHIEI
jgi:hypothetical protein